MKKIINLTPLNTHLLNAFVNWFNENNLRPFLAIHKEHVSDPFWHNNARENGDILFNVSLSAVRDLYIADKEITFSCRSGGVVKNVSLPTNKIHTVFSPDAREYVFHIPNGTSDSTVVDVEGTEPKSEHKRPTLSVVKN